MIYYKKIHYKDYGRAKYKYQDANGHHVMINIKLGMKLNKYLYEK